jgi:hypothetical protein
VKIFLKFLAGLDYCLVQGPYIWIFLSLGLHHTQNVGMLAFFYYISSHLRQGEPKIARQTYMCIKVQYPPCMAHYLTLKDKKLFGKTRLDFFWGQNIAKR